MVKDTMHQTEFSSPGTAISAEVLRAILQRIPFVSGVKREWICRLTTAGSAFRCALQPFLFRHVNLRGFNEVIQLFEIFQRARAFKVAVHLASGIHTLQISIDLDPAAHNTSDSTDGESEASLTSAGTEDESGTSSGNLDNFSRILLGWLPLMTQLHTLILCFDEEDADFLVRFLDEAPLQGMVTLRKLHCLSLRLNVDDLDRYADGHDGGPWDADVWSMTLCHPQLSCLEYLIISTPTMPFWPPTWDQARKLHRRWFDDLPACSNLSTFVLHCGYADDRCRLEEYGQTLGFGNATHLASRSREPHGMPIGLKGGLDTNLSGPSECQDQTVPAMVWGRSRRPDGQWEWSETSGDMYCGLGEHLYFEQVRMGPPDARMYGDEAALFEEFRS
ncbi:hypothetical protein DFH06DRAFT_1489142 [Mycena polygramma]|nr:hypothetical protein DFH06DRAFT_1489142 [Mycena polygramma]